MAKKSRKSVDTLLHDGASRTNIPTAEYESMIADKDKVPIELKYPRNPDLDPQLVWRGKDQQDRSDLEITARPIYIQEKIHPKFLIDDLARQSQKRRQEAEQDTAPSLFAELFDGDLDIEAKTEFYAHKQNWSNRMILGDSLMVMASLAEREGLKGEVQCIYMDPPYGIKFGSNWQVSTRSTNVKDDKKDQISPEPEMIKAFRDTWQDGIHSYMTYLRDRLTVSRDLLCESGSIFIQIGHENVHRVRSLLDEIFGDKNYVGQISFRTKTPLGSKLLPATFDYILWYSKNVERLKFRKLFVQKKQSKAYSSGDLNAAGRTESCVFNFDYKGTKYQPVEGRSWKTNAEGMERLEKACRLESTSKKLYYVRFHTDYPVQQLDNMWTDTGGGATNKVYVVQTREKVVQRCLLMATDPGDLVLDPTCGSGTTSAVAEQWGRRWITIDTSRVALALARTRLMNMKYLYYVLADSAEGRKKEHSISDQEIPNGKSKPTEDIRQGFVYERVPHITLRSIARNKEIDCIWEKWQKILEPLRQRLNEALTTIWEDWEIPRKPCEDWSHAAKTAHEKWWQARIGRQHEIDQSISKNGDMEYLYDSPYTDKSKIRVTGPFTVESLSPHRLVPLDHRGNPIQDGTTENGFKPPQSETSSQQDFATVMLEHLSKTGAHQERRKDRIEFTHVQPFPGKCIAGEGIYREGDAKNAPQKRAAILIGPEFGTLSRTDIVVAAREASELGFDVLITCAFNYEANASDLRQLANMPVLQAYISLELHREMAKNLKNTGSGSLFIIFGEPDIDFLTTEDGQYQVKINGIDVFHPSKGEVISGNTKDIAAWFIDTSYNEESFFVRHAYFLGANKPYEQLKRSLSAEIDKDAWESLYSDISRPFPKPDSGRIAVKVISHFGSEVMRVFQVPDTTNS